MKVAGVLICLAVVAAACDDSSNVPVAVLEQTNQPQEELPKVPTTQELISGPRKQVVLGPLPLTMRVPESWEIKMVGGATLLQGHAPSGEVSIQLNSRPSLKEDALDLLIAGAKKEQAEKPESILKVEVRPLGAVRVFERQSLGEPASFTTYTTDGKQMLPHTSTEIPFRWTLSVLAPHAGAFQVFELNFISLTKKQFDQDQEFLIGLLDTLTVGGDTSASQPTTLP